MWIFKQSSAFAINPSLLADNLYKNTKEPGPSLALDLERT